MTADTDAQISPAEIRDWARATGRPVGPKGRISAELRAEYARVVGEANAAEPPSAVVPVPPGSALPPGAAAADGPPRAVRGPERPPDAPGPAAQETVPRVPRSGPRRLQERIRARYSRDGSRPKRARRPRAVRKIKDRISTERVTSRIWESSARLLQPMNLPVARCLEWQAPTAGALLDQAVKDTFLDPVAQAVARWEGRLEVIGALVGLPLGVAALQLPANQPHRLEWQTNPQTGDTEQRLVPYPLGAVRHQLILGVIRECLEANAEAADRLPEEVKQRQLDRERRRAAMDEIISMFFAPPPGPGDAAAAAAEEAAMQTARERLRGA